MKDEIREIGKNLKLVERKYGVFTANDVVVNIDELTDILFIRKVIESNMNDGTVEIDLNSTDAFYDVDSSGDLKYFGFILKNQNRVYTTRDFLLTDDIELVDLNSLIDFFSKQINEIKERIIKQNFIINFK